MGLNKCLTMTSGVGVSGSSSGTHPLCHCAQFESCLRFLRVHNSEKHHLVTQYLTPCHSRWGLRLSSVLLASVWYSSGCSGHLDNEPVDGRSFFSLFLCLWINKNKSISTFRKHVSYFKGRVTERENKRTEIFHLLVHLRKGYNIQDWVRQKPRTLSVIPVSHTDCQCSSIWVIFYYFAGHISRKQLGLKQHPSGMPWNVSVPIVA